MRLPDGILDQFTSITQFDIRQYLSDYVDFIENHRDNIQRYYSGEISSINQSAFSTLNDMITKSITVGNLIRLHHSTMNNTSFWELIEMLDEIETSLETINNSSKWLRSSITNSNFSPNVERKYISRQFETLEQISTTQGSDDGDNDWVNIAIRNDLKEEDYSQDGGIVVYIKGSNRRSIFINSVVDNITGEKVYGLDIDKKITFVDNDLKVLSYVDTFKQSLNILTNLLQGDCPEFPQDGIKKSLVVGNNRNSVVYPILFRQLYSTFAKDDTLKSLKIIDVEITGDNTSLTYSVESRLGEQFQETTRI